MKKRRIAAAAAAAVAGLSGAAVALGAFNSPENRFHQIAAVADGVTYEPIISVGDGYQYDFAEGRGYRVDSELGDYRFSGIPDGIGSRDNGDGTSTVWVNHELSGEPGARVSELTIDNLSKELSGAKYIVDGTEGFQRFCSSDFFQAELEKSGHTYQAYYTGEENTTSIGDDAPAPGADPEFEAPSGGAYTYIPETGELHALAAAGKIGPWENTVALRGMGKLAIVMLEDGSGRGDWLTSRNNRSQLYLFVADSQEAAIAGEGDMYVYVADEATGADPGVPEDLSFSKGGEPLQGKFVKMSQAPIQAKDWRIADKAAEEDYGAFTFTRIEDGAQDPRFGHKQDFYFLDTGEPEDDLPDDEEQEDGTLGVPGFDSDGNLIPPTATPDRGRLYHMTFLPEAFEENGSLAAGDEIPAQIEIELDGDEGDNIVSPDNMGISTKGVLFNEDRNDQFGLPGKAFPDDEGYGNVVWWPFGSDEAVTVARVDTTSGDPGDWESSGTVLAPQFGEDMWLIDVQAHSLDAPQPGLDPAEDMTGQGGQLGLLKVPGSTGEADDRLFPGAP